MRDHRKLIVFQLADALVIAVYRDTKTFPREEVFGLTSQMRRCAVSAAANIVGGCARRSERDYARFLETSFSSLRELGYYIDLSMRLEYLTQESYQALSSLQGRAAAAASGLLRARRPTS
jgi:four helix bundle protein